MGGLEDLFVELVNQRKREKFENGKCDPEKHYVTYCTEYTRDGCPKTCYYATDIMKRNKRA